MSPYGEGTTAAQPPPSNQRQMSAPQAQMPGNGGGNGNGNPQQQQQHPQMGGPNPYGGYQQQHHRGGMNGMAMQGPPGGVGNPGFMQGHRNSMGNSMGPPPMNMGHQYPNQGGYGNPNFNQQGGMGQQQQQQQYGHQQQQQQQQHGYPQQMGMPGQQQHGMQQLQQGHPGQQQQRQQHQGNFHPNQQQQQQPQQRTQQPPQQQYGQQPNYGRQNSSNVSQPSDGQTSSGTGGPLNFNAAPGNNNPGNPSPGVGNNNLSGGPGGAPGGPGGDYGQQFLPSGLNGDWQSDGDMHHRREMIQHIVKLLKQKDKNASPEWLTKLPQMVKQLEVSLYRSAPSFEAYSDTSTLKTRLQQLAMEIAKKTQQAKDGAGGDGAGVGGQSSRGGQGGSRRGGNGSQLPPQGMGPMIGGNNNFNVPSGTGPGRSDAGADAISSQHGNPNDPEWKVRIRHKQQRLLLLHHSSKCPYEDGKCKVTPYCGEMKKLWKHMARCTDNECRVPHCFSSRSILSHYRKCKDPRCPACGPVRETVRKTQKSQRQRGGNGGGGRDALLCRMAIDDSRVYDMGMLDEYDLDLVDEGAPRGKRGIRVSGKNMMAMASSAPTLKYAVTPMAHSVLMSRGRGSPAPSAMRETDVAECAMMDDGMAGGAKREASEMQDQLQTRQEEKRTKTGESSGEAKQSCEGVDFTLIPHILDAAVEKSGDGSALRSTTVKTGDVWTRNRQENLLTQPKKQSLGAEEIKKEKNKAFDLLDALSRSGSLPIAYSELHVVMTVTHCFDKDVMSTVICDNVNPIEKLECSTLLLASAVHGVPARELIGDAGELRRLEASLPLLLQQSGSE